MKRLKIAQSVTNRDSDAVERYLNEIRKIDLLNMEDEVNLTVRIRNGDQAALHKLIKGNLRFVVSVAKKYQDKGLKLGDLISEGNIGLIKAAHRFDATKGFKFITFAVWWIRQSILLAIEEQRYLVRLPGNQMVGFTRITKAGIKLEQELQRAPTIKELAEQTKLTEDKIIDYIGNAALPYSLDRVANDSSGLTLMDTVEDRSLPGPDHLPLKASLSVDLNIALNILPKREQKIMMMFYGMNGYPETRLEDMEGIFNLGKERIRQLKDKAHRTLSMNCCTSLADYFYESH
jgi:RNA polymerase primary sigma factor